MKPKAEVTKIVTAVTINMPSDNQRLATASVRYAIVVDDTPRGAIVQTGQMDARRLTAFVEEFLEQLEPVA